MQDKKIVHVMSHQRSTNLQQKDTNVSKGKAMSSSNGYYKAIIAEIIRKTRRLSLLPPMISETLEKYLDDWYDILYGYVPAENLMECFIIAYRQKKEGEIFDASAICRVWDSMKALGVASQAFQGCSLCKAYLEDVKTGHCPFHQCGFPIPSTSYVCTKPKNHAYNETTNTAFHHYTGEMK